MTRVQMERVAGRRSRRELMRTAALVFGGAFIAMVEYIRSRNTHDGGARSLDVCDDRRRRSPGQLITLARALPFRAAAELDLALAAGQLAVKIRIPAWEALLDVSVRSLLADIPEPALQSGWPALKEACEWVVEHPQARLKLHFQTQ